MKKDERGKLLWVDKSQYSQMFALLFLCIFISVLFILSVSMNEDKILFIIIIVLLLIVIPTLFIFSSFFRPMKIFEKGIFMGKKGTFKKEFLKWNEIKTIEHKKTKYLSETLVDYNDVDIITIVDNKNNIFRNNITDTKQFNGAINKLIKNKLLKKNQFHSKTIYDQKSPI